MQHGAVSNAHPAIRWRERRKGTQVGREEALADEGRAYLRRFSVVVKI